MSSPTTRSLAEMRKRGYYCEVTEHWNAWSRTRKDLLGFGDILCLRGKETVLLQTTTFVNINARIRKADGLPTLKLWLEAGNRAVFHGWKKPNKSSRKWVLVEKEVFGK